MTFQFGVCVTLTCFLENIARLFRFHFSGSRTVSKKEEENNFLVTVRTRRNRKMMNKKSPADGKKFVSIQLPMYHIHRYMMSHIWFERGVQINWIETRKSKVSSKCDEKRSNRIWYRCTKLNISKAKFIKPLSWTASATWRTWIWICCFRLLS